VRSLVVLVCVSLSATALVAAHSGRDEGQAIIPVAVDLVVFNATVTDSKGRYVHGLTSADFHLSEDRHAQNIVVFTGEEGSSSIGLIIDNSGSMLDKRADVVAAALAFSVAADPDDELFVVHFNDHVFLGLPPSIGFTSNADQVRSALVKALPAGLTALYDALAVGIEHVKAGSKDRKALVVVSDGGDNASRHSLSDVIRMARESTAPIYPIGIYDATDTDRNEGALKKIATSSGGRAYFPESRTDLSRVWRDIAQGIRSQYTLGYYSSNHARDGAFRRVEITASRNGHALRVVTRDGYLGPTGKSALR